MHPIFAQVQDFLGYPLGRPTAPFLYTNDWGGVYALTIPFFILGWLQSRKASRRSAALLILAISLVPAFLSLNRGLWLSLLVALAYGATRPGDIGRLARRSLLAILLVGIALIAFTPLKAVVEGRAENQHSNAGREFLYAETVKEVVKSPVIGYGGPRPYDGPKLIPHLGTQGQFWLVLFSQGFVGAFFFVVFLVRLIRCDPARTARHLLVPRHAHHRAGPDLRLRHDPGAAAPRLHRGCARHPRGRGRAAARTHAGGSA